MYKIPPLKENFRLLENIDQNLVAGCVFFVNEIIYNTRKRISDRVYLTFPTKENKDSPINYPNYFTKPHVMYHNMTVEEFNELKYEPV